MGLSSSQARLLNLTSRMHQIEYKAAKIEAEKLQMANKSKRVYQEYQNALERTKIQYKSITSDGSATFLDATLAIIENHGISTYSGVTASKVFLLQNAETNEIYVTSDFAQAHGINTESRVEDPGDLDHYLNVHGVYKITTTQEFDDYTSVNHANYAWNIDEYDDDDELIQIRIPSVEEVAKNVFALLNKRGISNSYEYFLNKVQTAMSGKMYPDAVLACINNWTQAVNKYPNMDGILEAFYEALNGQPSGSQYTKYVRAARNGVLQQDSSLVCNITYNKTTISTTDYDRSSPEYIKWSNEWQRLKNLAESSMIFTVVDDELATNKDFLNNHLTTNQSILIDWELFGKEGEVPETSVATNTFFQEVDDEKELRKAEAKYEADMRQIDMKDRQFDYDLAALDAERNAVKQEMETLKTVAKDNVDRTFKLFG